MAQRTLVTNCSQLVSLAGTRGPRIGKEMRDLSIIENGAMLICDQQIEQVGKRSELERSLPSGVEVIDAQGGVVTPGYVDAHTHPVFAGNRIREFEQRAEGMTYQEIAAAGGGIRSSVALTRAASADDLFASARRYSKWFLRAGTTTVEAKSGYGLTLEDELKILRVIRRLDRETPLEYVPTFLGAHSFPDEYFADRDGYVDLLVEKMLPAVAAEGLAEFCDVFCEEKYFSPAQTRRVIEASRLLGLRPRLHADQLSLGGGAKLAAELRAATADHLENTDPAGISALASASVQPVLLPASVLLLGSSKYPPAREMIDGGLAVVLATDFNPGSSPTVSMGLVMSLAVTQMKMTPAEAFTAATINAAYSLGRGSLIGSLEPGKRADFCVHDCSDWRELAYFAGIEHSRIVYTKGQLCLNSAITIEH